MLREHNASLEITLDLQDSSRRLIAATGLADDDDTGLDVRFDSHT